MKFFAIIAVTCLCTTAMAAQPTIADAQRAADEKIQELSNQLHAIKAQKAAGPAVATDDAVIMSCPPGPPLPPQPTCAQDCIIRASNGVCISYGQDYCAPDAYCAEDCTIRASNGVCISYAADFCGPYANCTEDCTIRASNGVCISYGPDICN